MRVIQFVHTLNYGDAISGEAIFIHQMIKERGGESAIYALGAHEKVRQHFRPIAALAQDLTAQPVGPDDLVILHYSIASPFNEFFRNLTQCRRAVIYHNLTPPKWFRGYNTRVEEDLVQGIHELRDICLVADIVIADSGYNAGELVEAGIGSVEVLPLMLDTSKWSEAANPGIAATLRGTPGVNLLHVGRLAPNKCIEDIIKAFYFFHHKINKESRLYLVGIDIDTELYSLELRRLTSRLGLKQAVEFVGSVADSELRAFYENCDAYLCMSEHEGFCLPLAEAMYFGCPVIAFASTAIPETLGDGGILVGEKAYAHLAELIQLLVSDEKLRNSVIESGKQRARTFSPEAFTKQFDELFLTPFQPAAARRA